jgi:PAS domain S-box-containing protein
VKITSGLGEALPRNVLVTPMKIEEKVFGVIEIASFQLFRKYEIEFVEKLAESIASTIASAKIAERTTKLLAETQQQAEEMKSQEEEMRQNMEELTATQEGMQRMLKEVESKETYITKLLNSASDMIFTVDKNYRLVTWNNSFAKSLEGFGMKLEKGLNTLDWYSGAEKEKQVDIYNRAFKGEAFDFTAPSELNGTTYYFLTVYAPLRNENGEVFELAVFSRDTTAMVNAQQKADKLLQEAQNQAEELKAQEEELRQNMEELSSTQEGMERVLAEVQAREAFTTSLINASNDSILTIDRSLHITNCNTTFLKMYEGSTLQVGKGFDINKLFASEAEAVRNIALYERAFAGETFETNDLYKFGDIDAYYLTSYVPLKNNKGVVDSVAIFAKDVTAMTKAKIEVEAGQKQMKALLDVSGDAIMTIGRDNKIVLFNETYRASFAPLGIEIKQGFDVLSLFEKEKRAEKQAIYDRIFAGETYEATDHLVLDGEDHYFLVKHAPLFEMDGSIKTIAIFAKDITEMTNVRNKADATANKRKA